MISAIITDIIARFGVRIAIGLGIITAALAWDHSRINKGRQQERAAVERRADDNARKADAARRDADRLPADRLRDRYFRD